METWSKKTWKLIWTGIVILNIFVSGLVTFTVNAFSSREATLQGAAPIPYVDKSVNDAKCTFNQRLTDERTYTDSQDNKATERMNRIQQGMETKADKDDYDKVWNLLMENNRKIDETNKNSLEILKLVKKIY